MGVPAAASSSISPARSTGSGERISGYITRDDSMLYTAFNQSYRRAFTLSLTFMATQPGVASFLILCNGMDLYCFPHVTHQPPGVFSLYAFSRPGELLSCFCFLYLVTLSILLKIGYTVIYFLTKMFLNFTPGDITVCNTICPHQWGAVTTLCH